MCGAGVVGSVVRFWVHFLFFPSIFRLHHFLLQIVFLPWLPFAILISFDHQVLNSADAHKATVRRSTSFLVHIYCRHDLVSYRVRVSPSSSS